ncbi:MAG TPA: DMT family transporter, partial [Verrucomicrobiae bacterium]|nr:DMT family transporter [Verrucomicrobiae bacterium]
VSHGSLYAAVLIAAIAHASWNAIVKSSADRLLTLTSIRIVGLVAGLVVASLVPAPSAQSVPFLLAAAAFHYLYYASMLKAYSVGDMSQVYPISRGIAPPLVALLAAALAGEVLGPLSNLAVLILSAGILSLALSGRSINGKAVVFALLTGVAIAAYSFLSGLGVRQSASLLGYVAWLEIATGVGMVAVAFARRKPVLGQFIRTQWRSGLVAGLLSVSGYAIALWAMSELPLAPVVALRESSVVFGVIIGWVLLREEFGGRRVAAAGAVLAGIFLLGMDAIQDVPTPNLK